MKRKTSANRKDIGRIVTDDMALYRLIGVINEPEDYYYVLLNRQGQLEYHSYAGTPMSLFSALKNIVDYDSIDNVWNLNNLTYLKGLEWCKKLDVNLLTEEELNAHGLLQ